MNRILISTFIFFAGLGVGYFLGKNTHTSTTASHEVLGQNQSQDKFENQKKSNKRISENQTSDRDYSNKENSKAVIPNYVLKVLKYVEANGEAPESHVGGRRFKNLENLLPKTNESNQRINYQEWDVNRKIDGKNRGRERLVTGDDKSAYYTNDHYQSFKKIK